MEDFQLLTCLRSVSETRWIRQLFLTMNRATKMSEFPPLTGFVLYFATSTIAEPVNWTDDGQKNSNCNVCDRSATGWIEYPLAIHIAGEKKRQRRTNEKFSTAHSPTRRSASNRFSVMADTLLVASARKTKTRKKQGQATRPDNRDKTTTPSARVV